MASEGGGEASGEEWEFQTRCGDLENENFREGMETSERGLGSRKEGGFQEGDRDLRKGTGAARKGKRLRDGAQRDNGDFSEDGDSVKEWELTEGAEAK